MNWPVLTLSPAAEKSLERIADALDRLVPPPLTGSRKREAHSLDDLLVTNDDHLAAIEEEEDRQQELMEG